MESNGSKIEWGSGCDRYGRPYNGKKRGRKKVERFGKKCTPADLKWQREYYEANKEAIKKRRQDRVTKDPSILVREKIRRKVREVERFKEQQARGLKKAA